MPIAQSAPSGSLLPRRRLLLLFRRAFLVLLCSLGALGGLGGLGALGALGESFLLPALLPQLLRNRLAKIRRALHRAHAGALQRLELVRRGALTAGNDGAGVTHALAGRRCDARDVCNDWLADVVADELGSGLFVRTADLADHDDALGLRIVLEARQHVDEVHAAHWIAADAHASALAEAGVRRLKHSFISQRARARHDADATRLVDEARHDADLARARRDDARAVRTDEQAAVAGQRSLHFHHVVHRDAFGDAHDELDAGVGRFENRIGRVRRRHVDHADRRTRLFHCFARSVEHRQIEVLLAAAAGRHAADDFGAVRNALLGMKRTLLAREALADDARVLVDQNAHWFVLLPLRWSLPRAAATTF